MLTLLKKIFTWWNQDTFGTKLKTIFSGKLVGVDSLGNKYYQNNKDRICKRLEEYRLKNKLEKEEANILDVNDSD